MSDPLYKKELLRLAADAFGAGRLPDPQGTGTAVNPACGDRVIVDLVIEEDRIAGLAHDTKACIITQASAAIIGGELTGMTRAEVSGVRDEVEAMLARGCDPPGAPFDVYAVFDGVCEHTARHKCVLLPFEAVLAAFDASAAKPGREGA